MPTEPDVILASGSPRRQAILAAAGVRFSVEEPPIDDAGLGVDGADPDGSVMSLAWFKARQVSERVAGTRARARWIVAADTMCFLGDRPVGKPSDVADARRMILEFEGRSHRVCTGVCVLDRASGTRRMAVDSAIVALGALPAGELDRYLGSGEWKGKAGAYNLADRQAAGWPLRCDGDPETVMGLPSRLVLPAIKAGRG